MEISLRQMEAFVTVAERHSFSKAGEELFLSQSTVSAHIAQLEQALGTTLIHRQEKKNISLTEDGKQAYRIARAILNQTEALENLFVRSEEEHPLISVSASTVPSSYLLPELMTGFTRLYPDCKFSVLDGDSSFALERLQSGEAAFAFVGTNIRKNVFSYVPICGDRMVLITPNNEEYRRLSEADVYGHELLDRPMILRENGSGTRREMANYLKLIGKSSADLHVVAYMNNIESIKSVVANGGGNTVLSERAASDAIADGRVLCFPLEKEGPFREIYMAYLKNRTFGRMEREFLNYIKKLGEAEKKRLSGRNKQTHPSKEE